MEPVAGTHNPKTASALTMVVALPVVATLPVLSRVWLAPKASVSPKVVPSTCAVVLAEGVVVDEVLAPVSVENSDCDTGCSSKGKQEPRSCAYMSAIRV